ncbi:putative drug exporter of the RND superfamily [Actinopolymorpha cephalotaxi]|uniref:Putative drug exporter of the RND superfamily n=1 Tax=Actinopolymorpha cephalotaxi TaxID=504797 RepID=A0A1I2YHD1_9ACTN|nr:MMPL family transporter [Actinopolymorpha cephalotaxi]NYH86970.1 RND superfamily putative drug exporter [Actinopolymorpha cephalotaxi]SFH25018.1 putative drug exporter of the RND superfamily [Actinopolymorpha cephalotaxi]
MAEQPRVESRIPSPSGSSPDSSPDSSPGSRPAGRRGSVFARLAGWSARHRWRALVLWAAVLVGATVAAQAVGSAYQNDFSLPGTESQQVADRLAAESPVQAGGTISIVVEAPAGIASAGTKVRVTRMLAAVRELPHVADVTSPYAARYAVADDGTIAYATVLLDAPSQEVPAEAVRTIIDTAQRADGAGLKVALGGDAVRGAEESGGGAAEGIGLLAALVILVLMFGSVLAASLPIVIAVFAVGATVGLVALASHVAVVADFTTPLMVLVGLGVGIDYALLIFSRFRTELLRGLDRDQAARAALDTAGRTVFFAGGTVIIALMGLAVLGLGSLQGVAVAVALTVLVTMLASLTLLPALLAILGGRIERAVRRHAARARTAEGARWRRWSTAVQRRPVLAIVVPVVALMALCVPLLDLHLGFADAGNDPATKTSRQAYDLLAKGFGPGVNGPLLVLAEGGEPAAQAAQRALANADGVAEVTPPMPAKRAGVSTLLVFPDSKPQDTATADLVDRLRTDVLPDVARDTGATFLVGGATAAVADFSTAVKDRLALFVGVVVGLSALLLMLVFRSVLIPVKAAVLNLLSVGASLGVVTLVFQNGFAGGLFGVEPGPVEAFVPVMIFAIVFGLSMDYEVFLLSRMHEEWERTGDASHAISEGLATTARVVTAAAAIMIVVFGAFLLDPGRMLKQFGLGLAVAVFLDAVVIRCLVLPAVMQVLGPRAWWLPRWLRRLPRVTIDR